MTAKDLARLEKLFAKFEKQYFSDSENGDWDAAFPKSQDKLQSALESALESAKNKKLLEIASTFYFLIEDHDQALTWIEK